MLEMKKFFKKDTPIIQVVEFIKSINDDYVIQKKKEARRDRQNRYYWLVVGVISTDTGYTKEEIHAMSVIEILGFDIVKVRNIDHQIPKETKILTVKDYAEYLTKFKSIWENKLGYLLPESEDVFK